MIIKAINDTADENDLIFVLLMFDAYFCMHELNFFFIIIQQAEAIKKTMKEIKKIKIERQINDALNIRNVSITIHFHDLFFNAKIMI